MWREKSRKRREFLKMRKASANFLEENTPPSSPSSSFSRVEVGRVIAARNKKKMNYNCLYYCYFFIFFLSKRDKSTEEKSLPWTILLYFLRLTNVVQLVMFFILST